MRASSGISYPFYEVGTGELSYLMMQGTAIVKLTPLLAIRKRLDIMQLYERQNIHTRSNSIKH